MFFKKRSEKISFFGPLHYRLALIYNEYLLSFEIENGAIAT
jgi:hypothetical protein